MGFSIQRDLGLFNFDFPSFGFRTRQQFSDAIDEIFASPYQWNAPPRFTSYEGMSDWWYSPPSRFEASTWNRPYFGFGLNQLFNEQGPEETLLLGDAGAPKGGGSSAPADGKSGSSSAKPEASKVAGPDPARVQAALDHFHRNLTYPKVRGS